MNHYSIFDQIMVVVLFVFFAMAIIVPTYPLLKETDAALKEHDDEIDPEYERIKLEKYLSGFD